MPENSSQLIKRENAIRRRKPMTSGAGVKHRNNSLSTLSSLHSHTSSSSAKKNKSLSLSMNKPIKAVAKKKQEKYVIKLGNQQFMQQFSRTGSSMVVKEGEGSELQNLTLQQKIKFFFVLLMIPSAMVVFFGNNKFRDTGTSIDPNIQLSRLGAMNGFGGGFGHGFDREDGRRRGYRERMGGHYDPGSIEDHLSRLRDSGRHSHERHRERGHNRHHSVEDEGMPEMPDPHMDLPHISNEEIKNILNSNLNSDEVKPNVEKKEENKENDNKIDNKNKQLNEENLKKESFEDRSSEPKQLLNEREINLNSGAVKEHIEPGFKIIVLWTGMDDWALVTSSQPFIDAKCVINKCIFKDKSYTNESNAIVFNARHIAPTVKLPDMRYKHQKWIFFSRDSPQHLRAQDLNHMSNLFNWSWTYRSDSDIVYNFAKVEEKSEENNRLFKVSDTFYVWRKKSKMILWIENNCQTNGIRDDYLNELKKYIDVDVLYNCSHHNSNDVNVVNQTVLEELSQKYLFVIAFEKSFCKDYMSETLYKYLEHNIVPIVHSGMGGIHYSTIFATNTVIDANDFSSPQDLADYVLDIGTDFQKYKKFLDWKRNHWISYERKDLCQLCYKLHEEDSRLTAYPDMINWFIDGSKCQH